MQEAIDFFTRMPLFSTLPLEEIKRAAHHVTKQAFPKNTVYALQAKSDIQAILVICSGSLALYNQKGETRQLVGFIKPGEVFGGISILMNAGVSFRTVIVEEDCEAYLMPAKAFKALCEKHTAFHAYFLENFSKNVFDESLNTLIQAEQHQLFLSSVVPFSFLPEKALKQAVASLSLIRYPPNTYLCLQGETVINHLYIIQKGAAERYYEKNGVNTLSGLLGEGDLYGGISMLINNGIAVRSLRTTEESSFYVLPKKNFLDLCKRYPVFSEYFTDAFGKRMLDRSYASIINKTIQPKGETLRFFNQSVASIYSKLPVSCDSTATIQQAAEIMSQKRSSSIFVKAPDGSFVGVITDNDLRNKVIAKGIDIHQPVEVIMSSPLRTISDKALIFEALMTMMQDNIKHLAVVNANAQVVGAVTNHDMLVAQGQSPFFLIREINGAENKEALFGKHADLPGVVKSLISSGAKAANVNRLITTLSDAILEKLVRFALEEAGRPPARFAFMILGSEGRKEQTLKTDQDNAIIFEDVPPAAQDAVQEYFLGLAVKINDWLDQAGYSFCQGDIMARNPKWCQPLGVWKQYFQSWIRTAEPQDLLQASIFFDFRRGYGDDSLIESLRNFLFESLTGWAGFFRHLTQNALYFKPPIGFFRNFVVESKGKHRNAFDIKSAMTPIVDIARIYALKHNVQETNTQERLYQLHLKKVFNGTEYNEIDTAYSFLMQLRFVRQINAVIEEQARPDNYINPKRLSRIEQKMLKEIFKRIENFQERLDFDFTGLY